MQAKQFKDSEVEPKNSEIAVKNKMQHPVLEDSELIEKFKQDAQKEAVFALILKKYQARVYQHIRKMVIDHDDSDDLLQETFVKVWQNLAKFRGDSQLFTWIYRIASNECLSFLNKKRSRFFIPIHDLNLELTKKLVNTQEVNGNEIQLKLQKAILQLPDKQRLVFNMKYFEELKYSEISEILGTSEGALKASYHHAVKKIESFLNDEE